MSVACFRPEADRKAVEWRSTIASHLDEASATLHDEEVQIESWFKVKSNDEEFLLWYLRAKSIRQVFEVSMQLKHPIDKLHYGLMPEISSENGNIWAEPLIDIPRE